jgi:molybdopterin converting factor small subunit
MNYVRVRLNGHLSTLARRNEVVIGVSDDATVIGLLRQLQKEVVGLDNILIDDRGRLRGETLIAVGDRIIPPDELHIRVGTGSVVELLPMLAGG